MLILKAFINEEEIDQIHIQNVEHWYKNSYRYAVRKPTGIKRTFVHDRRDGWKDLARQVLQHLVALESMEEEKCIK